MIDARVSSKIVKLGFVAAILVVIIHADVQEGCPVSVRMVKDLVTGGVCGLAVPFFFAVSGYLLAGHVGEAGWWEGALKKRVWSLLVPYLIWNVAFLVERRRHSRGEGCQGDLLLQMRRSMWVVEFKCKAEIGTEVVGEVS